MKSFIKKIKKLSLGILSSVLVLGSSAYKPTEAVKINENDQILNCIKTEEILNFFSIASFNMIN